MENPEQQDSYYYPGGVPITPQAKRVGYEFPVYVSKNVWADHCSWTHGRGTNTDKRIFELLTYAWEGMLKRLAVSDDFLQYFFKIWYWGKTVPKASKKKTRTRLGARLFLDPDTGGPWLYIYSTFRNDTLDDLKKGEAEPLTGAEALEAEQLDQFEKDVLS